MTTIPTIPPCRICGDIAAVHGAETCLEIVTRQRDCAIHALKLAERQAEAWRWAAVVLAMVEKKEGI